MPTITDVPASFTRLRDNSWGARVMSDRSLAGEVIAIRRRNGEVVEKRLVNRVANYRDERHPALYSIEDVVPTTENLTGALERSIARLGIRVEDEADEVLVLEGEDELRHVARLLNEAVVSLGEQNCPPALLEAERLARGIAFD